MSIVIIDEQYCRTCNKELDINTYKLSGGYDFCSEKCKKDFRRITPPADWLDYQKFINYRKNKINLQLKKLDGLQKDIVAAEREYNRVMAVLNKKLDIVLTRIEIYEKTR